MPSDLVLTYALTMDRFARSRISLSLGFLSFSSKSLCAYQVLVPLPLKWRIQKNIEMWAHMIRRLIPYRSISRTKRTSINFLYQPILALHLNRRKDDDLGEIYIVPGVPHINLAPAQGNSPLTK